MRKEELEIKKKSAKKFAAFITEVAEAMKKHGVEDAVCIFGMDGAIRNTYIPLGEKGEMPLYCHISDAFNEWLRQGYKKPAPPTK